MAILRSLQNSVSQIRESLERDKKKIIKVFSLARLLVATPTAQQWLHQRDRSTWYYWPRLRELLLGAGELVDNAAAVRSLDESNGSHSRSVGGTQRISSIRRSRAHASGYVQMWKDRKLHGSHRQSSRYRLPLRCQSFPERTTVCVDRLKFQAEKGTRRLHRRAAWHSTSPAVRAAMA